MYNIINSSIESFESKFQHFEQNVLFDRDAKDPIKNFTDECTRDIGQIFQIALTQYNALLEGHNPPGEVPDYEAIAGRLSRFVEATKERTNAEFERKLGKKRTFLAKSRKDVWSKREEQLAELVTDVTRNIGCLRAATEAHLAKGLKTALPGRTREIRAAERELKSVQTEFAPMEGPLDTLSVQIAQEKDRWTAMIPLLRQAEKCKREAAPLSKTVQFFCKDKHPRSLPLITLYPEFNKAYNDLQWSFAEIDSFRNSILRHFREIIGDAKQIQAKYTSKKFQEIETKSDFAELKRDYNKLCVSIFYLRQMMDVPWQDHPYESVAESFQEFFLETAPKIDNLRSGLCVAMEHTLKAQGNLPNQQALRSLLNNEVPAIKKTWLQNLWSAICSFLSAIAAFFSGRKRDTVI